MTHEFSWRVRISHESKTAIDMDGKPVDLFFGLDLVIDRFKLPSVICRD